jgi:cytidine deaminase
VPYPFADGEESLPERTLLDAARAARAHAHAPYSHFAVGAALETAGGAIFAGCNVENASYGLAMCAERVAAFKAVSQGERDFVRVAVVTAAERPTTPCGACRQVLWELCGDIEVIIGDLERCTGRYHLSELLPYPFDATSL